MVGSGLITMYHWGRGVLNGPPRSTPAVGEGPILTQTLVPSSGCRSRSKSASEELKEGEPDLELELGVDPEPPSHIFGQSARSLQAGLNRRGTSGERPVNYQIGVPRLSSARPSSSPVTRPVFAGVGIGKYNSSRQPS